MDPKYSSSSNDSFDFQSRDSLSNFDDLVNGQVEFDDYSQDDNPSYEED